MNYKVLFLSHYRYPHVGGVEKHIEEIRRILTKKGIDVKVISEVDIKYPHIKFLGLFFIWIWLFKNRRLIEDAHIIHIHDVFIWYLPFRFLYPHKRVFTTFHGWEGIWPIPWKNIYLKRLAARLSTGTIVVGKYIEKYYGIQANKITYGGS
jgi:glycosyltransferase involved in cell wall biosynthesis